MIDFSKLNVVYCCAGNERVHDLYAAVFNVLMNTSNAKVTVCFNELDMSTSAEDRRAMLEALACHTNNEFEWVCYPKEFSKAKMISKHVAAVGRPWHLNIDDDFMIPYATLRLLEQASNTEDAAIYIYGLFDVINFRNYEDWSAERLKREDLFDFIAKHGMRCLNNHLCDRIPVALERFRIPGQSTGSYMFNTDLLLSPTLDAFKKELENWPKGKRGYDDFLCNTMAQLGPAYWIFGSNSFHTDVTRHHVDGRLWTQDVWRNDMRIDGTEKGRPPVDEAEAKSGAAVERPADAPIIPSLNTN